MIAITDKEFRRLADLIRTHYGINLKEEKMALVTGRLSNVLYQNGFKSFSEYFDHIAFDNTGDALKTLVEKMTTNHTFFMRESDHFEFFKNSVLPPLAARVKDKDLRIWSAGCSTGEEPSCLAMIMDEFFGTDKILWDTKILATDISSKVIDIAEKGIYENERLTSLPSSWRLNYFKKLDREKSSLVPRIRSEIIYRRFNLMDDFPFRKKFHIIFCRNVMIYFDNKTKMELVNKFYNFTEPGGYLFVGHSESLNRGETKYRYVLPAVYRKDEI